MRRVYLNGFTERKSIMIVPFSSSRLCTSKRKYEKGKDDSILDT